MKNYIKVLQHGVSREMYLPYQNWGLCVRMLAPL